jgi:hypothetical protein
MGTTSMCPLTIKVGAPDTPADRVAMSDTRPGAGSISEQENPRGVNKPRATSAATRSLPGGLRVSVTTSDLVISTTESMEMWSRIAPRAY